MKYNFDFLLLEFKDIYYVLSKIFEEDDLNVMNLKLIKFIKEVIITAHLNNKIFYNTENTIEENIEVLYDKKIISYDLMKYIKNYIGELYYIKELLENNIESEKREEYREFIEDKELIYEICVWLAVKSGEEDYSLVIDNLSDRELIIFDRYINPGLDNIYDEDDVLESLGIDDIYEIEEDFDSDEISVEENLLTGELYYLGKNIEKDYYKAKEYFEKAAKEGNEHAESYLGLFYEKGYGGEEDIEKALYWYKKAALKGNVFSQYSLGYLYYEGEKVEKNLAYSFKWYKEAAEKDFAAAQYALSYLYKNGEGCEQNNFKAYYWLEESADNDFEDAYYILGQSYLEGNIIDVNYKKAFFYLSKGVSKNDKNCLESLGDMYYWGFYVNEDKEKAFELYDRSMEEGNTDLYYKVGTLYEAEDNMERALLYYYKGHGNGNIKSTQRLAIMYLNGDGVKENKEKALEYIEIGVKAGDSQSLYIKGLSLLYTDKNEARKFLIKAYRKGSYYAAEILAREGLKDYINNKEVNGIDILAYVNKVMKNGLSIGIYYYGLLYYYGLGVEKNSEMAFINFKEAAENGCEEAILQIANWYKHGIFLAKDIDLAIEWYEKAIEDVSLRGILELIDIYEKGIGGRQNFLKALEGAILLREIDTIEGNLKLAYYYLKGIGVEPSKEEAYKYINELMTLDEGKAYNLLGELGEEGLIEKTQDDIIEYYAIAVSFGEKKAYSNLQYYLFKNKLSIRQFKFLKINGYESEAKSLYVKAIKTINKGKRIKDKSLIDEGIQLLTKTIYLDFYKGINDLIKIYEKDDSIEGQINLYKYKEMKVYYNLIKN